MTKIYLKKTAPLRVLSLFDGVSCAQVALKALGHDVEYYASEIDKYAIEITQRNHPDTVQLGSVKDITLENLPRGGYDLLIGGSPCQDLSVAKANREGLSGARSGLFYEYLRLLREIKPKYFVLENVASMPKDAKETITRELGVEPIMIDANLVSAQNRKRLFWTNIPGVELPTDRGIYLKDILQYDHIPLTKYGTEKMKSNTVRTGGRGSGVDDKHNWDAIRVGTVNKGMSGRVYSPEGKNVTLKSGGGGAGAKTGLVLIQQTPRGDNKGGLKAKDGKVPTMTSSEWQHNNKLYVEGFIRPLTAIECERLQCLPDNYTEGVSNAQRYKALGNAFNVEVVKHILGYMPVHEKELPHQAKA